jgi:hypothetical protein
LSHPTQVQELWRYPVKSLAGEEIRAGELAPDGFRGDRVMRAVTASGRRITARTYEPDTLEADPSILRRFVDEFDGRFALDCYVVEPGFVRVGDEAELIGHWTIPREMPSQQLGNVRPAWMTTV